MKTKIIIFLVLISLLGCGCAIDNNQNSNDNFEKNYNEAVFKTENGNVLIQVETAKTLEETSKGLMWRERLGEYSGMLFVFPNENQRSFWMKNTLIKLDIIFISKDKKIVSIAEAVPCLSQNTECSLYKSEFPAQYVIEVNGGFCKKHNIKKGDSVEF